MLPLILPVSPKRQAEIDRAVEYQVMAARAQVGDRPPLRALTGDGARPAVQQDSGPGWGTVVVAFLLGGLFF